MSNYKDLSSEELKRTLAEKQDILRRTMKPDEYKNSCRNLMIVRLKLTIQNLVSLFNIPKQRKKSGKGKRRTDIKQSVKRKTENSTIFATVLTKIFPLFLTIYTLAVIPVLFLVWQIYKLISADSWQAIFHTTKTIYVVGYIVIFFALTRLQTALYIYANE